MLYDVPQTDSTSEAAMAALVARLRDSAPKPEAFPAGAATDRTIAIILARWVGMIVSALGDRAVPPILQWDAALDGACIALASRSFLNSRGRNRQAGADDGIDQQADEALTFLARCKPGTPEGKRENPIFVDSKAGLVVVDRVRVITSPRSDSWAQRNPRSRCCP